MPLNSTIVLQPPALDPAWDHVWLDYQLAWPLGLLLTPHVLARYNSLFQYLMRLKRIQIKLDEMWQNLLAMVGRGGKHLATSKRATSQERTSRYHHLLSYRFRSAFAYCMLLTCTDVQCYWPCESVMRFCATSLQHRHMRRLHVTCPAALPSPTGCTHRSMALLIHACAIC